MKSLFIITIVAVAMIGVMVPSVFGQEIKIGDSIVQEIDCDIIGNEIDSNIDCKIALLDWFTPHSLSYDGENNILYQRAPSSNVDGDFRYVGIDINTYEIISDVNCDRISTGTYEIEQTIPCEPKIESSFDQTIGQVSFLSPRTDNLLSEQECQNMDNSSYPSDYGFSEYYDDELILVKYRDCQFKADDHWSNKMTMGIFNYDGEQITSIGSSHGKIAIASSTDQKYVYYSTEEDYPKLNVISGENFSDIYTYNFPPLQEIKEKGWGSKVFHNEESNKVYYFIQDNCSLKTIDNQLTCMRENSLYVINGMGNKSNYNVDLSEESYATTKISKNQLTIASFVDQSKDPQHYIDRYNNEPSYKEWFDENYPQYLSIYQAIGLEEPIVKQINEPEYVPEPGYTPEPVMEQEVNCGPGTESVNGVCQVIQTIEDTSKSIAQPTGKCANLNRGAMLSGCDLHGMDLRTNLAGADLSGANLSGANLDNGVFSGANLSGADLSGTSLCYTHFDGANLSGADFTNSNFCEPHLDGTTGSMGPADMRNVNLSGLDIGNTSFDEVNLSGANLSNLQTPLCADFERSNLINADLSDADLDCAFFTGAWLDYADLSGADLHDANFEFASLQGANLSGADLSGAKFWGDSASAFNEKKLDESLEYVGFTWGSANMQGVNLQNANLQNANLQNANLDGADITGANIFGANFIGVSLENLKGFDQTISVEKPYAGGGGGCLIATATYGSEMATEVQQLRELRDNQLLQTESGTAFMATFNDIYYSFSPTIADYERENPYFKEAVKLAITPMISSLSLMENAESESEVLSIGISVIALNLAMYLGVPAIVIVGIRKKF